MARSAILEPRVKKMAGLKKVELCKMFVGFEDMIAHCVIITIRK